MRVSVWTQFYTTRSVYYYDGVLFIHKDDGALWSVINPGLDNSRNEKNLLNPAETRSYIAERWGKSGEVRLGNGNLLFVNDKLANQDFQSWAKVALGHEVTGGMGYLGMDVYGNTYWNGGICNVRNQKGEPIAYIDTDPYKVYTPPYVEYSTGDLYFLGTSADYSQYILYRLERTW